jgi:protein CpxP
MKTKIRVACLAMTLMAAGMGQAWAGEHHAQIKKGNDCSPQRIEHQIYKSLDLSQSQKDQLKTLRKEQRAAMQVNKDTRRAERLNFNTQRESLLESTNFDVNAARTLLEAQGNQQVDVRLKLWEWQHARWNVLTSSQKTKFKREKAERFEQCASQLNIKAKRLLSEK